MLKPCAFPLSDCIDIHREVSSVDYEKVSYDRAAMIQPNLSARAYRRILKLVHNRGFSGSEEIQSAHLAEALQYRPKLMME